MEMSNLSAVNDKAEPRESEIASQPSYPWIIERAIVFYRFLPGSGLMEGVLSWILRTAFVVKLWQNAINRVDSVRTWVTTQVMDLLTNWTRTLIQQLIERVTIVELAVMEYRVYKLMIDNVVVIRHWVTNLSERILGQYGKWTLAIQRLREYFWCTIYQGATFLKKFSVTRFCALSLLNVVKRWETLVRCHLKTIRHIRRAAKRVVDPPQLDSVSDEDLPENEPKPKLPRLSAPSDGDVMSIVCRWFMGPITPEKLHFASDHNTSDLTSTPSVSGTTAALLHTSPADDSYHSSEDPDYDPAAESSETEGDTMSSQASSTKEELEKELLGVEEEMQDACDNGQTSSPTDQEMQKDITHSTELQGEPEYS